MADTPEHPLSDRAKRNLVMQYELTFDNAAVGIAHVALDGRWLKVNTKLCHITGYTRDELLARKSEAIAHPDDLEADWAQARRLIVNEITTYAMEKRYLHKNGSIVWVTLTVSLVRDREGCPRYFIAIIEDITVRKRAEDELRRIAWLLQPDLRLDVVYQPYGDLTELNTRRELLDSVGAPLLSEVANDYLGLLGTSGAVYESNGDYAFGLVTSRWCRFMDEASRAACGTADNAAALRSGQWHCHESCWEASRRSMETGQPVDMPCKGGIRLYAVPITANGVIVGSINFGYGDPPKEASQLQAVSNHYGVPVDALRALATQYESRPPYIVELAKKRLRSSAKLLGEIVTRRQAEAALRRSEQQLRELSGRLEQLVEERTKELVESQQQLRSMAAQLNLAEQRERKRLAIELHDHLQQQLVSVKLKLGQGKRLPDLPQPGAELIQHIDEVVTNVLAYTRTLAAELSPPVLRDLGLAAGLQWLGDDMKRHDLTVTVVVPSYGLPPLAEDVTLLLFQCVRELLVNVWKHAAIGQAHVEVHMREDELRIDVSDYGRGFNAAAAFRPSPSGAKFGLLSIRERMQALGGQFTLRSSPDKGTTATLMYSLEPSVDEGRGVNRLRKLGGGRSSARASLRASRIRLLIVDDHAMVRQGLCTLLGAFSELDIVGQAADGVEAVELVAQLQPDVVLMDINMPRMNGIKATAEIKSSFPDTIVIGVSFHVTPETRKAMTHAGAAMLVSKEAAVDQLYAAIRTVLAAR